MVKILIIRAIERPFNKKVPNIWAIKKKKNTREGFQNANLFHIFFSICSINEHSCKINTFLSHKAMGEGRGQKVMRRYLIVKMFLFLDQHKLDKTSLCCGSYFILKECYSKHILGKTSLCCTQGSQV